MHVPAAREGSTIGLGVANLVEYDQHDQLYLVARVFSALLFVIQTSII